LAKRKYKDLENQAKAAQVDVKKATTEQAASPNDAAAKEKMVLAQ
jgi:hypothetical protein